MRAYKTLTESRLDEMTPQELLAAKRRIQILIPSAQGSQRRKLLLALQSINQRLERTNLSYTNPRWGIMPRNFLDVADIIENVDPDNEAAQRAVANIREMVEENTGNLAPSMLQMIQTLDEDERYDAYDFSEVIRFAQARIDNLDLIDGNENLVRAAEDFHAAIASTSLGFQNIDEALLRQAWSQVRSLREFVAINNYYSSELNEQGQDITESMYGNMLSVPRRGWRHMFRYLAELGISHQFPAMWYSRSRLNQDRDPIPQYVGLPDFGELPNGYEYQQRGLLYAGESDYSVDPQDGKLSRATIDNNNESVFTENIDDFEEVTYEGDEFSRNFGTLWYNEDKIDEAEYQGRTVKLGKPMRGDVKKFKVYVRNPKGNVVKVNFGDPDMRIRKSDPDARRSFRARHNCDNPGPRHKARYWSCRKW